MSERLPHISAADRPALFLDLDGTIIDIAAFPDAVEITTETRALLERLTLTLGGAVAIVTGRDVEVVDKLLAPLRLPVAGSHGSMRRDSCGRVHAAAAPAALFKISDELLASLLEHSHGLYLERKSLGLALHYRRRPELKAACITAMEQLAYRVAGIEVITGKMVVEARLAGASKGTAIDAFMREPPFAARLPVFAGDDETDEAGFAAVNGMGGVTIKVGEVPTAARWRVADPAALREWLRTWID